VSDAGRPSFGIPAAKSAGFAGAILGVGIAGMLVGAVCGLFLGLRLEKQGAADVSREPVVVSAIASALVGLLIASVAISALW